MAVIGGSSTNPPLIPDLVIGYGTTFSPPYAVKAMVHCFGAGGSGAASHTNYGGDGSLTTGGGAGEHSASILDLSPSVTYTAVVGAGGVRVYQQSNGGVGGNAGGLTSFAGSGITTITANGGGAGGYLNTPNTNAASQAGGAGGAGGAGAFLRYTGGAGGSATRGSGGYKSTSWATGGGAVGIYGTGFAGGNCNYNGENYGGTSGGGGTGSQGGQNNPGGSNILSVQDRGAGFGSGTGGSTVVTLRDMPGNEFNNGDRAATTAYGNQMGGTKLLDKLQHTFGHQGVGGNVQPPGVGGTGFNAGSTAAYVNIFWSAASLFAGGGGTNYTAAGVGGTTYFQGLGGYLGGGGGAAGHTQTADTKRVYSGNGGNGGVLIMFLERS